MKKLFTMVAALTLAFSAFADKIYFQTTSACQWDSDEAKIGAIFRTGMDEADYGLFTDFFTAVDGVAGLYEADVPSNEEPWVSVQFLRYNPATTATKPFWGDFWNGTSVEEYDGTNNMFTATSWGTGTFGTTGSWSVYVPGGDPTPPVPTGDYVYFQTTEDCDWSVDGAKIGAIFRTGMTTADYGLFTEFFETNGAGLFYAEIPANEEPFVSVQFLRYNPATTATKPFWGDFWNGTDVEAWDASKNMFTATSWGGGQLTTTGTWSAYVPTSAEEAEEAAVNIYSNGLAINAEFEGEASVFICNMAGVVLASEVAENSFTFVASQAGIYIVKINNTTARIMVR